jgi:hypothetical protein
MKKANQHADMTMIAVICAQCAPPDFNGVRDVVPAQRPIARGGGLQSTDERGLTLSQSWEYASLIHRS